MSRSPRSFSFGPAVLLLVVAGCGDARRGTDRAEPEAVAEEVPIDGVHGRAPAAVGGVPALVMLEPRPVEGAPNGDEPPAGAGTVESPVMDQLGGAFVPRWLVARPGEPVTFTNSEAVAHNVHVHFAPNDSTVFNRDTGPRETARFTFETVGPYDVTCDAHPGMTAFIYVTTARYAAFAGTDRSFHIPGVAPGEYTLRFWSPDPAARSEQVITVVEGEATEVGPAAPEA